MDPEAARSLLARAGLDLAPCEAAPDPVRCYLEEAYRDAPKAAEVVLSLYERTGSVTGLEPGRVMDGGWRGEITLVPERPIGRHLRHLRWVAASLEDFDWFFSALQEHREDPITYRFAPLELAFFRSVRRTTPSAYARGWRVAYNVNGSLHRSEKAVRETMFHEIFHLNDAAQSQWSEAALGPIFDRVVARCTVGGKPSTPCLRPYAPGTTMVRGGTFYAFQPGNGVGEYAAELALRYYREHRQQLKAGRVAPRPFKCGPPENAQAWEAMATTFFGGVDLIECP